MTINVRDADAVKVPLHKPLPPGRAGSGSSRPVALSNEDKADLETIAGTDFATQATLAALLAVETAPANVTLLSGAAATGNALAVTTGHYHWRATGTWDGATAQLEWSPDGGVTWFAVDDARLTDNGQYSEVPLAAGHARVVISSAGGSTAINSSLIGMAP